MKIVTYCKPASAVLTGVVVSNRLVDVSDWIAGLPIDDGAITRQLDAGATPPVGGILRWLQSGDQKIEALIEHVNRRLASGSEDLISLADVRVIAPVPRPGKIIGVGRNYADHAKEIGAARPTFPKLFLKASSSVVGPGAAVFRPAEVCKLDSEVELAAVIGGWGYRVPLKQALSLVAGYTVLNDLSARDYQFDFTPAQTSFAKGMDGFTPMGPWLVTSDEIPDPQNLRLSSHLNSEPMQVGHTADMLFSVAELVAYCSHFMTLEPGDVIATGTPAGVGAFRSPPLYLEPGDRLRFEIERVGVMEHSIANHIIGPKFHFSRSYS